MRVLLPLPEGPSNPISCPALASPETACRIGRRFCEPRRTTAAALEATEAVIASNLATVK